MQNATDNQVNQADAPWKYWAFLSYSHRDKAVANWLHKSLESYRIPARLVGQLNHLGNVPPRLFPVFRDREELPTSSDLGSQIQDALRKSRFIIVLASPHAAASRWVNEEVRFFKHCHGENRVLCLILDGEPNATCRESSGSPECFPPSLRFQVAPDGSLTEQPVEPIAADLRPGGDGRRISLLKVVAGLAGVGFDALRQRDRARARKRLYGLVGAAALVCVVALGFAYRLSLVERRQRELERNQQAQGNLAKPYSDMRLSDPTRRAAIGKCLADATQGVDAFRSWLLVSNRLNPQLRLDMRNLSFPPDTDIEARVSLTKSHMARQQVLWDGQSEHMSKVSSLLK